MAATAAGAPLDLHFLESTRARSRERMCHAIAVLAAGLASPLPLEWVGIIYAGEVLLAVAAFWAILTNLDNPSFWRRPFTTLMACLGVTMLAYIVADLLLATAGPDLQRGWARIIFLGTNLTGLYFLCRRYPVNILIYVIACAAGMLAYLCATGHPLDDWKFGASAPVTLLVACLVPMIPRRGVQIGSLALAAVGVLHIALDSREIGGNCLLAGLLLFARSSSVLRWKSFSWVVLGVLASAGIGVFLYAYVLSDQEYAQRRHFSNAWRTAALVTALNGIADSPLIGNGSQANNFELQSRYDSIFAARTGVRYRGQQTDTSTFSPHSQILQAWFEAGILATTFFVYLGCKLVTIFKHCILHRGLDGFSVLFAFCLLRATWHLLFSPFAGLARMDIALAAVVVVLIDAERRMLEGRTA